MQWKFVSSILSFYYAIRVVGFVNVERRRKNKRRVLFNYLVLVGGEDVSILYFALV
jgi:hypothetical protein